MVSLKELSKLVNSDSAQIEKIIDTRVTQLKSEHEEKYSKYGTDVRLKGKSSGYKQFLHSTRTRIIPQAGIDTILLFNFDDEKEIYNLLISKLKSNADSDIQEQKPNDWVIKSVADTVYEYVGGAAMTAPIDELKKGRMARLCDLDFAEQQVDRGKISLFKDSKCAWCAERAAIAHQLFKFLGYDSVFVFSPIKKNYENEIHAFNIIQMGENDGVLFDATMPRKRVDEKGEIIYDPVIMRANSKEEWQKLSGLDVTPVTYDTPRQNAVTIDFANSNFKIWDTPLSERQSDNIDCSGRHN